MSSEPLGSTAVGMPFETWGTFKFDLPDLNPAPGLQQPCSWHEIIEGPTGGFKASGNVLTVLNQNPGSASVVTVSDIVFLYHAKTV
jgi:hypothetical protein